MSHTQAKTHEFSLTQLSGDQTNFPLAIGVFAYNEAKKIKAALNSIANNTHNQNITIYVLANGCSDSTAQKVRESASEIANLWLVETDVADKATTWNLFVHEILSSAQLETLDACFFMDGDVTLTPETLPKLAESLAESDTAEAAGAMPATGRDRDAWRERMVYNGMLAGNCYALRSRFIQQLRQRNIQMPAGLIGEDFFVSWLVANHFSQGAPLIDQGNRFVFRSDAEFAFQSLSPWRLSDIRTYLGRKWRYTLRNFQHQMLIMLIGTQGLENMPRDINELYRRGKLPSRLVWSGLHSPIRFMAVHWIHRKAGERKTE